MLQAVDGRLKGYFAVPDEEFRKRKQAAMDASMDEIDRTDPNFTEERWAKVKRIGRILSGQGPSE